ncbi:hypothetical protein [Leptolyngbya sp. FACHB-261]|uniref:WD40/YVTN/BNR-like repeat-containing protein n=1 Tax=Leptolyngbya sp. FACHB-261 TaxID=2692806 RepID=UPI0016846D42|nr:hypothetical protein [Leptolyngbya sp. FACHB-261]MBD2103237.1 hypothetical protein [Leptolyngbya sp. FACHB-261]
MSELLVFTGAVTGLILAGLVVFLVGQSQLALQLLTKGLRWFHQRRGRQLLLLLLILAVFGLPQVGRMGGEFLNSSNSGPVSGSASEYQRNAVLGRTNVAIGGGGYVTGIYLHPLQADLIYIKTDVGGFYRWNAADRRWIPLTDHFPLAQKNYYGGEALALDPNNPDLVYIAVGNYTARWWPHQGTIFKSTNRGEIWTKLNLDLKMGGNEKLRWTGERLAVNPQDSRMLFFGSRRDGLWQSLDAGLNWHPVTAFPGTLKPGIGITAVVFKSQVPGFVYAVAYKDGIYQSPDAGITWSKLTGSPAEPKRLAVARDGSLYVTHESGVSKYANDTWQDITPFRRAKTFNALSVNPSNANDLLVSLGETTSTKIYRSLDGGSSWTEQARRRHSTVPWWTRFMRSQPWIAAIAFDPKNTGRVWLTDWYGIWRTDDISRQPATWTNQEQGHEELVLFSLVSPPEGALLISGAADVEGFYHDKGLDQYPSRKLELGKAGESLQDTYSIAFCEADPQRLVRVGARRWNSTYNGATSTDGGRTWQPFADFPTNKMPLRVAVSATQPDVFVVTISEDQALRSTDGGASWQRVSGLPDASKGPWNWSQSLTADKVNGDVFYYYSNGKVYRSIDGGNSFVPVNRSLPREDWHSLKTVPGVEGEVWLSLDQQGLYQSTNGGKTFNAVSGVKRAYLFAFGKPQSGSTTPALYLYGELNGELADLGEGIFRSLDRGKTWRRLGDPQRPIGKDPKVMEASRQQFGLVFVGTGGRGVYYGTS